MITLFRSNNIHSLQKIKDVVTDQLRSLAKRIELIGESTKMLRCEFCIEEIDILTWLHNQKTDRKIYWSERSDTGEVGAIGIADLVECRSTPSKKDIFETIEERISTDNPYLRYYGGFCFDATTQSDEWQQYGVCRFVAPRFEVVNTGHEQFFAVNILLGNISPKYVENIIRDLDAVDFSAETHYRTPPIVEVREDYPDKQDWMNYVNSLVESIKQERFTKVVLARRSDFTFDKYINPIALTKHLKDKTPNCFHFCIQLNKSGGFLGASPERLFRRYRNTLETEAVAGTAARGLSDEEDAILEKALVSSTKELFEHNCVVHNIEAIMAKVCEDPLKEKPLRVLKLKGSQHLLTQFEAELRQGIYDSDILEELHPTPAVGGTPRKKAMEEIKRIESFDRGWYAGPVGYISGNGCEFAVGIRSGLVQDNKLSLYTGAGIVQDSVPQKEWEEVENKISRFIKVFDVQTEPA